jgi:hypothetical protein
VPATANLLDGSCCIKTVAQSEFLSTSPTKTWARQNLMDGFYVPLPEPVSLLVALAAGRGALSWHRCDLPPPTDLVTTLQHLVI